jgi:hypothetical protein
MGQQRNRTIEPLKQDGDNNRGYHQAREPNKKATDGVSAP